VAICDQDLYQQALDLLRIFYKTDQLKFQIFEESFKVFPKTLQVLYSSGPPDCQQSFNDFATHAIRGGEDPAFLNFMKTTLLEFKNNFLDEFMASGLEELLG
jgi:hypothetical protein